MYYFLLYLCKFAWKSCIFIGMQEGDNLFVTLSSTYVPLLSLFFFHYYSDTLTVYRIKIYLSKHNSVGQAYYLAQAKLRKGTLNTIKQISYI
jgi:hypothetical protein